MAQKNHTTHTKLLPLTVNTQVVDKINILCLCTRLNTWYWISKELFAKNLCFIFAPGLITNTDPRATGADFHSSLHVIVGGIGKSHIT